MNEWTDEPWREERPEGVTNEMASSETENPEDSSTGRPVRSAGSAGSRGRRGRFESRQAEADRFWSKVDSTDRDGCWAWQGRVVDGYGRFDRSDGTQVRAHRMAWELTHGPLPEGLTLDHLVSPDGPCTTTHCVRPVPAQGADHLEPVTAAENVRRRHARARARKGMRP